MKYLHVPQLYLHMYLSMLDTLYSSGQKKVRVPLPRLYRGASVPWRTVSVEVSCRTTRRI